MRQRLNTRQARAVPLILAVVIVDLMGMAYCHIKDVGMKFDERVYYMAYLFCGNIASSIALAAFALACYAFGSIAWLRRALAGAVVLSLTTIAGFVWSRTLGFPQMADHIGQWDTLGLSSLIFEGMVVLAGGGLFVWLRREHGLHRLPARPRVARSSATLTTLAILALGAALLSAGLAAANTGMSGDEMDQMHAGNTADYPDLAKASPANRARARRLHLRTNAARSRFDTLQKARRRGYTSQLVDRNRVRCPGLVHLRKAGGSFRGKLLDPTAPQALVFWCSSEHAFRAVASMYRAPAGSMPPLWGGLLGWHRHTMGGTWMTHVWYVRHTREALANCAPFDALRSYLGIRYEKFADEVGHFTPCPKP